jgi:hypothetical protein
VALTPAEKQRRYRERLKAKQPKRVVPDFVDHPIYGRVMTLASVQRDCADLPWLQGEVMARAAKAEAALEADGDVVDDDEVGDAD